MKKGVRARDSKVKSILDKVLQDIKPGKQELGIINNMADRFILLVGRELKKQRISAEAFIGGSLAKGTLLRRERYDIDIFVRFNYKRYSAQDKKLSSILEKIIKKVFLKFKLASREKKENSRYKFEKVHGSRDYFCIKFYNKKIGLILFEIIPVLAINKPTEARNVTDLSFFHVNHIKKQISKKPKIIDEILLAKAFCYAHNCYGAESHIRGLSGYALEVLLIYYGNFINFIKAAVFWARNLEAGKKRIIDPSKHYKRTGDVLLELNEAKLISPIVLIDPTYQIRNIAAAVSPETLNKLIQACKEFRKKPSLDSFKQQEINIKNLEKTAKRKKAMLCIVEAKTSKIKEDIAAAKLVKFFNFLVYLLERNDFKIMQKEIKFEKQKGKQKGLLFLIYKKPEPCARVLIEGPPAKLAEHAKQFKQKYKKTFSRGNRICAYASRKIKDMKDLIGYMRKTNHLADMSITQLSLVK